MTDDSTRSRHWAKRALESRLWFALWKLGRQLLPVSVRPRLKRVVPRRWVPMGSFERACPKAMDVSPGGS